MLLYMCYYKALFCLIVRAWKTNQIIFPQAEEFNKSLSKHLYKVLPPFQQAKLLRPACCAYFCVSFVLNWLFCSFYLIYVFMLQDVDLLLSRKHISGIEVWVCAPLKDCLKQMYFSGEFCRKDKPILAWGQSFHGCGSVCITALTLL